MGHNNKLFKTLFDFYLRIEYDLIILQSFWFLLVF